MNTRRFLLPLLALSWAVSLPALPLAFPGAAGFGKDAEGARGGNDPDVYIVTSLSDNGAAGTLRHAVDSLSNDDGRFIVFAVGGVITLNEGAPLIIDQPYVTIAGQTAPNGGICIRGEGIYVNYPAHDVIIRGLRVRPSDYHYGNSDAPRGRDAIKVGNSPDTEEAVYNVIIDHCTFSWGLDETAGTYRASRDVTFQYNIIASSLQYSIHEDEPPTPNWYNSHHSTGFAAGPFTSNISVYRNLLAHHMYRNPMLKCSDQVEFINNYIYNHDNVGGELTGYFAPNPQPLKTNIISNIWIGGPDTHPDKNRLVRFSSVSTSNSSEVYLDGNVAVFGSHHLYHDDDMVAEGFTNTSTSNGALKSSPVFSGIASGDIISLSSAEDELDFLIDEVGARWPARDAVDTLLMSQVVNGTGSLIDVVYLTPGSKPGNWTNAVGTRAAPDVDSSGDTKLPDYDTLGSGPQTDNDDDGIPDSLESVYGSNPLADSDSDGYLNIEEYINAIIDGTSTGPMPVDVSLTPAEDSFVRQGEATTNFDDEGHIRVKNTDPSNSFYRVGYIRFDCSALTSNVAEGQVTLTIESTNYQGVDTTTDVELHLVESDSWQEETLTFSNRPTVGSLIDTQEVLIQTGNTVTFYLSEAAVDQINDDGYLSVAVLATEIDKDLMFVEREASTDKPLLELAYVSIANLSYTPVDDSFVRKGEPTTNFNSTGTIYVKNTDPANSFYRVGYLRYDCSNITGTATDGILTLTVEANGQGAGSPLSHSLYLVGTDNWEEDTLTFNNRPSQIGLIDTESLDATIGETITFDLNQAALDQINDDGYLSVLILSENDNINVEYHDRNDGDDAPWLDLVVEQ